MKHMYIFILVQLLLSCKKYRVQTFSLANISLNNKLPISSLQTPQGDDITRVKLFVTNVC